jgi:hypothetical protein
MVITRMAPRAFRPRLEVLEDRFVPAGLRNGLFAVLNQSLQAAVTRIQQLQARLPTDLATMRTDAGTFTFFTESMATQTKVDQDYALLMSDVAQIQALDTQIHNAAPTSSSLSRPAVDSVRSRAPARPF